MSKNLGDVFLCSQIEVLGTLEKRVSSRPDQNSYSHEREDNHAEDHPPHVAFQKTCVNTHSNAL